MSGRACVVGTGMYVPARVVENQELAELLGTSPEWIQQRTGIQRRRFAERGQSTSELAYSAASQALAQAGVAARDLDFILFATLSPDVAFPGSGCYLQARLGAEGIPSLDIRAQCSGFIYGLCVAGAFLISGQYKRILLVGAEIHSSGLQLSPEGRNISALFGDGAGAVVLEPARGPGQGLIASTLGADGHEADVLSCQAPRASEFPRISHAMLDRGEQYPVMNGRRVFRAAIEKLSAAISRVLAEARLDVAAVGLFLIHQANLRIVEAVAHQLGISQHQIFTNIEHYGNTTSASLPMLLHEAVTSGRIQSGDYVVLAAFGSGFTWGAAVLRW